MSYRGYSDKIDMNRGEDLYITETVYDQDTGLPRRQFTKLNGMLHSPPDGSPSYIGFVKGLPQYKTWHRFDMEHREDGLPSSICVNLETGIHYCEVFRIDGKPRDPLDGPFRIFRDGRTGKITLEESYEEGLKRTQDTPSDLEMWAPLLQPTL